MSSGSNSSARSSPSSSKYQMDTNPTEFVIPGQQPVRFPNHPLMNHNLHHGSKSPTVPAAGGVPLTPQYYIPPATGVLAAANVLTSSVHSHSSPMSMTTTERYQQPSGHRRASDVTTTESTTFDTTSPPMVPKTQRRFSLAQALSTNQNSSSSSSGLMRSLSKNKANVSKATSEETITENVVERKESIVAPLPSDPMVKSPIDRPQSPTFQSGRKGSTTSIGSTSGSSKATNNGAGKRRQSRTMAFFSHRLGSEAIPDMKSLSVSSSSTSSSTKSNSGLKNLLHGGNHDNRKAPSETYRLVVLGGSRVGKTAIVSRFLYNTFPEAHSATVEELHRADYEVKGLGIVGVEILDTSGSFPFPAMQRLAINSGHAFILVYSIDDKESFEEVSRLRELVLSVKSSHDSQQAPGADSRQTPKAEKKKLFSRTSTTNVSNDNENPATIDTSSGQIPLVIVANKSDLDEEGLRVVGTEMAECECIDWDVAFVEASARTGDNVMNIFHKLLLQAHLKGILRARDGKSEQESSPTKLKVSKVPKVSNRRRSSLPVNELFHGRHLPLFGGGGKGGGGGGKGGESSEASSRTERNVTSPTTSSGDHSGRSSCALS